MISTPSEDSDQSGHLPSLPQTFQSLTTHKEHSEDSDQTGRMPRLIWVLAGRPGHFVSFVVRRLKLHIYIVWILAQIVLKILISEHNYLQHQKEEMSQLMRLWYLLHRRPAKAQASLHIRAVSQEPSLFAHIKYGSRRRVRPKIRDLAPLDGCAYAFEKWVYGGRKVP